jgi:hypothetical protein
MVKPARRKRITNKSKVTREDISIMLELVRIYNTDYDFQASEWFWGEFKERTFEEFRRKYQQGSRGAQLFERFTSRFELVGILVEHKFLNENLYFDRYGATQIEWEKSKPIIYGLRREWSEPRYRENFQILSSRGRNWLENHPPKVNGNEGINTHNIIGSISNNNGQSLPAIIPSEISSKDPAALINQINEDTKE